MGVSVILRDLKSKVRKTDQDTNKKVFDPELYPIVETIGVVLREGQIESRPG